MKKPFLLIPALFLAACATRAPRTATIAPPAPPSRPTSAAVLRTPEQLREYRFGRYVDPGDPRALHEAHPVYRVETSAGWNLRPGGAVTVPASRVRAEAASVSTHDAVVAEVNKQRAATRAFTEQTARLNQQLATMAQAVAQADEIARQNVALKRELAELSKRLDASDARERERKPAAADRRQAPAEDKW
jgi:hypothetical protein